MTRAGSITTDERTQMVLAALPRTTSQLVVPFAACGQFCGLTIESCERTAVPDAVWADYQSDLDCERMASRYAAFFRATFAPSLSTVLDHENDAASLQSFHDRLEFLLRQKLLEDPTPIEAMVETIVHVRSEQLESGRVLRSRSNHRTDKRPLSHVLRQARRHSQSAVTTDLKMQSPRDGKLLEREHIQDYLIHLITGGVDALSIVTAGEQSPRTVRKKLSVAASGSIWQPIRGTKTV